MQESAARSNAQSKVFIGADHRGFQLKEHLVAALQEQGYTVEDCGNKKFDPGDDYPDFALAVAEKVAATNNTTESNALPKSLGIVICGSGVGASVAANKVATIRAAQAGWPGEVQHARQADNINVLTLSADYQEGAHALDLVNIFLQTEYEGAERHRRRLQKIHAYEQQHKQ